MNHLETGRSDTDQLEKTAWRLLEETEVLEKLPMVGGLPRVLLVVGRKRA